jgi:flagellar protein FlgJ
MMMKSMRDASFKSDLVESQAKDTFEGMFDKEVSLAMAKKNTLGLADMLIKNMPDPAVQAANAKAIQDLQVQQAGSTASFLQARASAGKGIPLAPAEVTPLSLRPAERMALPLPRTGGPMPLSATQRPIVKVDAADGGAAP